MNDSSSMLTPSSQEVIAIPVNDNGEPLVDVRESSELTVGPVPECPETEPDYARVRRGVFERLLSAQRRLPTGQHLRLYEGYRSAKVQDMLFQQELDRVLKRYPGMTDEAAFRETTRLVSPAYNWDGTLNIPPHGTGGAVDVEIVDCAGSVLDFGMEIRDWARVEPSLCATYCDGLSSRARKHRDLLLQVMTEAGFVNYAQEWWHFSYGDRLWAYSTGHEVSIYGCPPANNELQQTCFARS